MALGAAATVAVGAGTLGAFPANAETGTQIFNLTAAAVAMDSTTTDPAVPLNLPFSVGSYGASTLLDSSGESTADAGAPYSPLISSLPSTGNGIAYGSFGTALPVVPTFPGYVSAKDPVSPFVKQNAGGYELVASADPDEAHGNVSIGVQAATSDQNNAFALANSISKDGTVFTEAAAGVHAFTLSGILDIANVSSYASLTHGADGQTLPVSTTDLGTISFAGLKSGATGDGFSAFGSAPTPISADGLNAINEALKPSGITLTYLPSVYTYTDGTTSTGPSPDQKKTVSGLVSSALRIAMVYAADRGTTTETVTLGRVAVTATSSSVHAGTAAGSVAGAPGAQVPGGAVNGLDAASGLDAAGLAGGAVSPGALPTTDLGAATSNALPTQTFLPAASFGLDPRSQIGFGALYLILGIGAGVLLIGGQAVRAVAIRLR